MGKGESRQAARNKAARAVGFRNYYHYRKATSDPKIRRVLDRSKVKRGKVRYELAGLLSNVTRLPGKRGSKKRDRVAGILSDAIRRAGGNPTNFWEPLGSPKKARSDRRVTGRKGFVNRRGWKHGIKNEAEACIEHPGRLRAA
jgi:hypothetical protein